MDNHREQSARHREPTQGICRTTNSQRPAEVPETSPSHLHIMMTGIAYSGEVGILQVLFLGAFPEPAGRYWGKLLFTNPNLLNKESAAQIHQSGDII